MNLRALSLGICNGRMGIDLPILSYLIELADGKLALIDTGMHRLHIDDPGRTWRGVTAGRRIKPIMNPEDSLLYRLSELGIAPGDIDYVVNTHLHFDHAGNNDLFSDAVFFVQREQFDFAKGNLEYPNQYWHLPHLNYELLDGEQELFPGLRVLPTPGHSPGHQSILLQLAETGQVIVCGDAIFSRRKYELDDWGGHADPVAARKSAMSLLGRAHAAGRSLILYGHDPVQARTLRFTPTGLYR